MGSSARTGRGGTAQSRATRKPDCSPGRTEPASTGRYTVEAAAKALQILDAFSVEEPVLSIGRLTEITGIPRGTAFRLLATLEERGYLTRSLDGYRLGLRLFALGSIVAADLDLRKIALPHLLALRDATGETAQVAILEQWQVVYVERVQSPRPVAYMKSRVGAILPAYCTGLGKALLACEDPDAVRAWAMTQHFARLTPTTLTTVEDLLTELAATRIRGFALDNEEREVGVRCIAAPIRTIEGRAIAAISIAAPADRLPADLARSDAARHVLQAAEGVSRALGLSGELAV